MNDPSTAAARIQEFCTLIIIVAAVVLGIIYIFKQ